VAKALRLAPARVELIESGSERIRERWLDILCDLLGVRPSYFFVGFAGGTPSARHKTSREDPVLGRSFAIASCFAAFAGAASAEVSDITVARTPGFGNLPMAVMQDQKLVEKHAKDAGLGDISVNYTYASSGAAINDGLLSGRVQIASGGVAPFLILWDRTHDNLGVHALRAVNNTPMYLVTRNPDVHSIADFSDRDRINVLAPRAALQAIVLQMAAAKTFGQQNYAKLDPLTVGLPASESVVQLVSGRGELTADFVGLPFAYQELDAPGVHLVLSTDDVMGGRATNNILYATSRFYNENPKTMAAIMAAYDEALELVDKDRRIASEAFLRVEGKYPQQLSRMVSDPAIGFVPGPQRIMKYAEFMHDIGSIKAMPAGWQELFFATEAQKLHGD
jgi:NitT/TauT family transport system substrate-binding protein